MLSDFFFSHSQFGEKELVREHYKCAQFQLIVISRYSYSSQAKSDVSHFQCQLHNSSVPNGNLLKSCEAPFINGNNLFGEHGQTRSENFVCQKANTNTSLDRINIAYTQQNRQ